MDFRELSYIIALAKHGTIVQAAKELYISQPSLSKFLQRKQKEIGVPLFERIGKQYRLTYAGERYVETSQRILDLKRQLDGEMYEITNSGHGRIRVAFPLTRGSYILPTVLPAYRKLYPNVKVEVREVDSEKIQGMVINGDTDVAIISQFKLDERLCYEVIAREELVMILQKGHPLAKKAKSGGPTRYKWVDLKDFEQEKVIMLESNQRSKALTEMVLQASGVSPETGLTLRNTMTMINMVKAGFGYGFILDSHVQRLTSGKDRPERFSIGRDGMYLNCIAAHRNPDYRPQYETDFVNLVRDFYMNELYREDI